MDTNNTPPTQHNKIPTILWVALIFLALLAGAGFYLLKQTPEGAPPVESPSPTPTPVEVVPSPIETIAPAEPTPKPTPTPTPVRVKKAAPKKTTPRSQPKPQGHAVPQTDGEEADLEELSEEMVREAKDWDLPEKPKIDVNSQEMKVAPTK